MRESLPLKQPISTLIVIHTPDLQVLLIERADHPGYWQSVTGSRENEEALIDTATREVFEETGLIAAEHQLRDWQTHTDYEIFPIWRHRYPPGVTTNREHVFSLQVPHIVPITLSPREHLAARWLDWQHAAQQVFSPSNAQAILQLPHHLGA